MMNCVTIDQLLFCFLLTVTSGSIDDGIYTLGQYIYITSWFSFSCFLLTMSSDSIEGIYDTLKQCALISKSAGGIGLNVHCIRATGSYIAGVSD